MDSCRTDSCQSNDIEWYWFEASLWVLKFLTLFFLKCGGGFEITTKFIVRRPKSSYSFMGHFRTTLMSVFPLLCIETLLHSRPDFQILSKNLMHLIFICLEFWCLLSLCFAQIELITYLISNLHALNFLRMRYSQF